MSTYRIIIESDRVEIVRNGFVITFNSPADLAEQYYLLLDDRDRLLLELSALRNSISAALNSGDGSYHP